MITKMAAQIFNPTKLRELACKARFEMQENARKDKLHLKGSECEPTSVKALIEYTSYVMELSESIVYED